MTVTSTTQNGKTPIGVVVCSYSGGGGQAMALKSIGSYKWSTEYVDISGLTTLSKFQASQDVASCENSAKIRAQGNSSTYPAVWAAYNYTTTGTKVGKVGGTKFKTSTYAWPSSALSSDSVWRSDFLGSNGLVGGDYKDDSHEVRPVIEF